MKKMIIALVLLSFSVNAQAATKQMQTVTCKGEQAGAHTLIIGKCSFEGAVAGQVVATCKNENDVCQVQARGWNNGQGIYIITSVESVKLGDAKSSPLTPAELQMAKQCKARKPCSLTCNRAHDAGRDDLIKAGACAE